MELRAFWAVLSRWRWVIFVVTGAAIVASGALAIISPPGYKARTTLSFTAPPPPPNVTLPGFDEQNRYLFAEQAVDDFTKIIPTRKFADGVSKRLTFQADPERLERIWIVKKQAHHLLSIEASAPTEDKAIQMAKAAGAEIAQNGSAYYKDLNTPDLSVAVLDDGVTEGLSGRLLDILFIVARVVAGLIVGIGLAFLLNYMDDRIRGVDEAEALGLRVIGAIPHGNTSRQSNGAKPRLPDKITAVGS